MPWRHIARLCRHGARALGMAPSPVANPVALIVEPINFCNLSCPACRVGTGRLNRAPRAMTSGEFRRILGQVAGRRLRQVSLSHGGEPFLCKDLLQMVHDSAALGLRTRTCTNGHFFRSDAFAEEVVRSGLNELVVRLDGADQETISRYRKNARFDELAAGIQRVLGARARHGNGPVVELQYIVMRHNEHLRDRMRETARELGVDQYRETLPAIADDKTFHQLAQQILPANLEGSVYERGANGVVRMSGRTPPRCERLGQVIVVESNGDVSPCEYDVAGEHVVGNLFEQAFDDVWNGGRHNDFRERVARLRYSIGLCRHCPEGRPQGDAVRING